MTKAQIAIGWIAVIFSSHCATMYLPTLAQPLQVHAEQQDTLNRLEHPQDNPLIKPLVPALNSSASQNDASINLNDFAPSLQQPQPGAATGVTPGQEQRGSPPDEDTKGFCGRWVGWLAGNDSHVQVIMNLECSGNRVWGTFLWSSHTSGTNKRALTGYYDSGTNVCILKDNELLESMPAPHWKFCPVDRYELKLLNNNQELAGHFWSVACKDRGTIRVHRENTD